MRTSLVKTLKFSFLTRYITYNWIWNEFKSRIIKFEMNSDLKIITIKKSNKIRLIIIRFELLFLAKTFPLQAFTNRYKYCVLALYNNRALFNPTTGPLFTVVSAKLTALFWLFPWCFPSSVFFSLILFFFFAYGSEDISNLNTVSIQRMSIVNFWKFSQHKHTRYGIELIHLLHYLQGFGLCSQNLIIIIIIFGSQFYWS